MVASFKSWVGILFHTPLVALTYIPLLGHAVLAHNLVLYTRHYCKSQYPPFYQVESILVLLSIFSLTLEEFIRISIFIKFSNSRLSNFFTIDTLDTISYYHPCPQ